MIDCPGVAGSKHERLAHLHRSLLPAYAKTARPCGRMFNVLLASRVHFDLDQGEKQRTAGRPCYRRPQLSALDQTIPTTGRTCWQPVSVIGDVRRDRQGNSVEAQGTDVSHQFGPGDRPSQPDLHCIPAHDKSGTHTSRKAIQEIGYSYDAVTLLGKRHRDQKNFCSRGNEPLRKLLEISVIDQSPHAYSATLQPERQNANGQSVRIAGSVHQKQCGDVG